MAKTYLFINWHGRKKWREFDCKRDFLDFINLKYLDKYVAFEYFEKINSKKDSWKECAFEIVNKINNDLLGYGLITNNVKLSKRFKEKCMNIIPDEQKMKSSRL